MEENIFFPVCPHRNVEAAFQRFLGPDSGGIDRFLVERMAVGERTITQLAHGLNLGAGLLTEWRHESRRAATLVACTWLRIRKWANAQYTLLRAWEVNDWTREQAAERLGRWAAHYRFPGSLESAFSRP